MSLPPDRSVRALIEPLLREMRLGRQWVDRTVVLVFALLTGLVVTAFTALAELATGTWVALQGSGWTGALLALLWSPVLTVAVLMWTRRFAREAGGSGIPQVLAALHDVGRDRRRRLPPDARAARARR